VRISRNGIVFARAPSLRMRLRFVSSLDVAFACGSIRMLPYQVARLLPCSAPL
jgi:hypothetical protein